MPATRAAHSGTRSEALADEVSENFRRWFSAWSARRAIFALARSYCRAALHCTVSNQLCCCLITNFVHRISSAIRYLPSLSTAIDEVVLARAAVRGHVSICCISRSTDALAAHDWVEQEQGHV